MWLFWDFFSTLFHWGKNVADDNASTNAKERSDEVKYWTIWDETVQVVNDQTLLQKAAKWLMWIPWAIADTWHLTTDSLFWKQDVDQELIWLKYNWELANDEMKNDYIKKLAQYESLANKTQRTLQESIRMWELYKDLNNYTVPDTLSNWDLDDWWFWYDSRWSRRINFLKSDDDLSREVANDPNAKWVPVDRKKVLDQLKDNERYWNYYWATDPEAPEKESWMRVVTKEEFQNQKKAKEVDDVINKKITDAAEKYSKEWVIAPGNPWWRKSTIDEMLWLFEVWMQDRWISSSIEAAKQLYAEAKSYDPALANAAKEYAEWVVDYMIYALTDNSGRTDQQIFDDYVAEKWNPFKFDVNKIEWLSKKAQDLIETNSITFARNMQDSKSDLWDATFIDWYYTMNALNRQIKMLKSSEKWENWDMAWHWIEYLWATLWWYVSWWIWAILWASKYTWQSIMDWEARPSDYEAALFWWQSSSTYNSLRIQANPDLQPDFFWSDALYTTAKYTSIFDDIVTARFLAKLDFPVKTATFKNVNKVLNAAKKLEKAVDKAEDVASATKKVESTVESIVSSWEKATKSISNNAFFDRVSNATKRLLGRYPSTVTIWKWDQLLIHWQNIVRWAAEEVITSAAFQWMTPYDYNEQDLAMDMMWATFSWFIRSLSYLNKTWNFKYQARDMVWTHWYLTEVQWYSPAKVVELMDKMDEATKLDLWRSIRQTMEWFFDTETISKKQVKKSKAQIIWQWLDDTVNKLIDDAVERADQSLMRQLVQASDLKYRKLVKIERTKWADWHTVVTYSWNKPSKMSQSDFNKKIRKARLEVYSKEWLEWVRTLKWRAKRVSDIKKYVRKNLAAMAAKGSKATRELVEKVDWKWRFKKWVSKEVIEQLYKDKVSNMIKRSQFRIDDRLRKWAWKDTYLWIWVQDYESKKMWPLQTRFAMFVNDMILQKKLTKENMFNWLMLYWKVWQRCFKRWLQRTYEVWDYRELSVKELETAISEFFRVLDEKIFEEYLREWEWINDAEWISKSKRFLANLTYEEAIKINPDLKYMSPEMFSYIKNDSWLTIIEKELKLRSFTRTWFDQKTIFWLDSDGKVWQTAFNDTWEEKIMFWEEWYVYIWHNKKWPDTNYHDRMNKDRTETFNKSWAKKYKYELDKETGSDWRRVYKLYDEKWNLVWFIETKSDVKDPKTPQEVYWSNRILTINVWWVEEWWSVDIYVHKWSKNTWAVFVQLHDFKTELPEEKMDMTSRYFDEKWNEVPETSLKQWNEFAKFVRNWKWKYNTFVKLIPWFTDNVPESYFYWVMNSKEYSASQKMALLMWMMFNTAIKETNEWLLFDLTKRKTFNRRWFEMKNAKRNKDWTWTYEYTYVKWDSDIMYESLAWDEYWICFVKLDNDSMPTMYFYKKWRQSKTLELYQSRDAKKSVGVISFWQDRIRWYVKTWNKPSVIIWSIEFLDRVDEKIAQDTISSRYWSWWFTIKVDWWDEMYKEIYKELYWQEMPDDVFFRVKSTPNMTPSRYLDNEIKSRLEKSEFAEFFHFKKWDWKNTIKQFNEFKKIDARCRHFKNLYPDTEYSNRTIYQAAMDYERASSENPWWVIKLTQAQKEIYNAIMWWKASQYWEWTLMNMYAYIRTWIPPVGWSFSEWVARRLNKRRNVILKALYKDWNVNSWSAAEKNSFLSRMKRKLWKDLIKWTDISIEDLAKDIEAHPDEYKDIIKKAVERVAKEEHTKEVADKKDMDIIKKWERKLNELEWKVWKKNPVRVKWKDTDAIQLNTMYWQKDFVENKMNRLINERNEAMEAGNEDEVTRLNREIEILNNTKNRIDENIAYKQWRLSWEMTEEQLNYMVHSQFTWRNVYEAGTLTEKEINERVQRIQNSIPWCRIIDHNNLNWETFTRWLTQQEQLVYANTLNQAVTAIKSHWARAAHISTLHAIVIDPKNVSTFDLWHEWFHEAVYLLTDRDRIRRVINQAYEKFWKEIEEFAVNRWYWEWFTSESARIDAITEEWLAERFWEYVQWRITIEDWTILKFFEQLWNKIKMMFSNTEIMELFDDIYEWKKWIYNDIEINMNPKNTWSPKYRIPDRSVIDAIDRNNPLIWDNTDYSKLVDMFWYDDAAVLVNKDYAGRWTYFTSMKQPIQLEDWRFVEMSYDDMYEAMMRKEKEVWIDEAFRFLYGSNWDFYKWLNDKPPTSNPRTERVWPMSIEVTYPRVWQWDIISSFRLTIEKWWEWLSDFVLERTENMTTDNLAKTLASMWNIKRWEYSNIIKAFQTYSLNAEAKQLANIPLDKYEEAMAKLWPQYKRFITQDMPDVLEKSIETYQHAPRHISFNWYKNIDRIEEILNKTYRNMLFDRHIQHTAWSVNWVLADMHTALFNRKWERTLEILNEIEELWDDHLTWAIWKWAVFTVTFTDNMWQARSIGWHMTPQNFQYLIDSWLRKWWDFNQLTKIPTQTFYKSILVEPEWTHYRNAKNIWIKPSEAVRKLRPEDSMISFRWNPYAKTYKFWWTVFSVDWDVWFLIQKNMKLDWLRWFLENWKWISSSMSIRDTFSTATWYWPFALLWNKLPTKWKNPFDDVSIFSRDAFTPRLEDVLMWYFDVFVNDLLKKYPYTIDEATWEMKFDDRLIEELSNLIWKQDPLKSWYVDWLIKSVIKWETFTDFYAWHFLQDSEIESKLVKNLLSDEDMVNRIFNESFKWNIVWVTDKNWEVVPYLTILKLKFIDDVLMHWDNSMIRKYWKYMMSDISDIIQKNIEKDIMWNVDLDRTADNLSKFKKINDLYKWFDEWYSYKDFISAIIVFNNWYRAYFEWYSKYLRLSDYWWIVARWDNNFNNLKNALDDYNYKYYVIDDIKWMKAKDFEDIIDKYVKWDERSFIIFKYGEDENVDEWAALNELRLVDRRTWLSNTTLDDDTLQILHSVWLDWRVIDISAEKYQENFKEINKVLWDYWYNIRKDSPQYYNANKELKKKTTVRTEQTWNNAKRRLLNKEYRDTLKEVNEAKKRMKIRQEKFDEFKESPIYYQATKLKEALDSSLNARKAVQHSIDNPNVIVPENIQSYKATDNIETQLYVTTDATIPYAKDVITDNFYQVDNETMISTFDNREIDWKKDVYKTESQILKEEVDICLPVWKQSLNDPDILSNVIWADSFAIWATDSDVFNKFRSKIEAEMPEYTNVYNRPNWNIAYYRLSDLVEPSDEVKFRKTERNIELENQIKDDKNISEATAWSVVDATLVCNI